MEVWDGNRCLENRLKNYLSLMVRGIFPKSPKIWWKISALFSCIILSAFTEVSGLTHSSEPVVACFLERPQSIQAFSRPDLTAKLHLIYASKLVCSSEIIRDNKGNEFRYVQHNDRSYPGRAYVRASDVHTDASRGGPDLDAWVATLRQHIADRRMFVAQELAIAARSIFQRNAELAEIELAVATDPLQAHSYTNLSIDSKRREVEGLRNMGKAFSPFEPGPERTSPPRPGATVYAAVTGLQLLEEPRESGAVMGLVPIGAKAEVLTINGPWTKVRLEKHSAGTDIWEVSPATVRAVSSYRPVSEGYALWESFSDHPPTAAELLTRAGDFEKTGHYPEAFHDLKRAAALITPSSELGQRLRTAGVMAGQYVEAIRLTNIKERIVTGDNAHAVVEMQTISRCRGDRVRAPVLDLEVVFAPFYTDSEAGAWLSPNAFSALPDNTCLLPFGNCGCQGAKPLPEHRRLQREFTDGPWLKIEVFVPARPFDNDSRLFIFETPNYYKGCGGKAEKGSVRIFPAVPWPEPGGQRTVWVKLKSLRGFRGAVEASNESDARKRAIEMLKKCDPEMQLPDRVKAIGGARNDVSCGC